ncbi:2-hydroxy-6-oxononadienedioate/2-hydroxy-6-oxononatrienedioate hydrolase [Methylobacterium crusticola]|uniref:2-hydroxy-6-oxononadienedioate/2-hydroxy-6-oxononatrienedioate hydrolase n=1 Tax=Methylobacterium crusticola TaxID=1697972 RepID=A0ABQ4R547_9HYPH|nr:alpha/beta fold hydrolase [Methylobacterium crusticola]GJD51966.1 2-hydroxy-6-oxononadienedioate/2-hydroxy-6-oxononatrienedioate hydrolase [Methylobacterium crusticola]
MKPALVILALGVPVLLAACAAWLYTPDRSRTDLEARYLDAPTDYVEAAGMRLHVRDDGPRDAPAIVMMHGFGSSLHTWEPWAQALAGAHRVVRFDLPGFGLTGPDPTGDYGDARSLEVLAGLMDRLGVARASLIGNSIGGRIAWKFAALNPARVDRLVLVSPDGFASRGSAYGQAPAVPASIRLMRFVLPTALVRMSLAPAYGDPTLITPALVARYRDLMLAPGVRDAMIARMEQAVVERPEPLLGRIEAPTLLVWGEKDALIPISNAADYASQIGGSRVVALPGLGHVPQEEAPEVSLAPVREFLE